MGANANGALDGIRKIVTLRRQTWKSTNAPFVVIFINLNVETG